MDIIAPKPGIYQLVGRNSNHLYIGSTVNLKRRRRDHFYKLKTGRHRNSKLQNYYDKYGKDSLTFEVILFCDETYIRFIEQKYLDRYNPHFNICKNVLGTLGYSHTEETKELMSIIKKEYFETGGEPWNKGRNKSKKEKEKISEGLKRYYKDNPHPREGKTHSKETKDKISEKLKERKGEYHSSDNGLLCQISIKDNSILNTFVSTGEAADKADLNSKGNHKTRRTKILEATKIEGRTAYGYKWEWRKPRPNKTG